MADFKEIKTRISRALSDASSGGDAESYQRLAALFSESAAQLREEIQSSAKDDINRIIGKLTAKKDLTADELKIVELWIVGDATYYLKMENNFNEWLVELKRIVSEIEKLGNSEFNLEAASTLRAMLEDGNRVIYDIVFFLERQERVKKFKEATEELDDDERDLLSKLLRNKLLSKEY